jgi:GntR family transcriptional regulator/MocR family aminotransferase
VAVDIVLARHTNVPLFVQIREQLRDLIQRGVLRPGMRLPPVRTLASVLKVNQITVAKTYRELVEAGLVEGRRGGGSFIRGLPGFRMQSDDADRAPTQPMLAERLYELARAPGVISFSSNYPRLDDANVAEFQACLTETVRRDLQSAMQYDLPAGRPEAREQIACLLNDEQMLVDVGEVVITSGSQQAIDLTIRALCPPGTAVLVEQPAYYGAINAFRLAQSRILEVPGDTEGPDLASVEDALKRDRARVIYLNPTFQNPSGATISLPRRKSLLALAKRYDAVILEDDHASDLRFRGAPVPAIRSLPGSEDHVVYVRTFGKTILPGTRLGFMVCPPALLQRILLMKANADLHCNGLMQIALARFLERKSYPELLGKMRAVYSARQTKMFSALKAGLPPTCRINCPEGGLSFWLTLPENADTSQLYFRAVRRGVAFIDGSVFYAFGPKTRSIRVSFGRIEENQLEEGIERLCSLVNDLQQRVRSNSLVFV